MKTASSALVMSLVVSLSQATLTPNTFYLLCYKRADLQCQAAEREVQAGLDKLLADTKYQMIPREVIPRIEVIECLPGQNRERCKGELGHNTHELMPPRIKIVP